MELCAVHIAPGWQTRPFTEADIPATLKLCRGNPACYRHMGMEPTAWATATRRSTSSLRLFAVGVMM